jgi:hypothetical protein
MMGKSSACCKWMLYSKPRQSQVRHSRGAIDNKTVTHF